MPKDSPIAFRMVLISFSDVLPRFLLQQLGLRLLHQVRDGTDVGGLQAVGGAHRELQLGHAPAQVLVQLAAHGGLGHLAALDRGRRREVDQQGDVIGEDARGFGHGRLGRDAAVGPNLQDESFLRGRRRREALHVKVHALDGEKSASISMA
jgi:hypothetical protein